MEQIILSDLQRKMYSNYEERVIDFFKKKFSKRKIISFIVFLLIFIVVSIPFEVFFLLTLFPHGTHLFAIVFSALSTVIFSRFTYGVKLNLEVKLRESFSSSFSLFSNMTSYEINFVDCSSFICRIKKEELQNIFKEEAEKEIKVLDSLIEEDKKREEEKVETMYNIDKLELMKRELVQILEKLEK